MTEQTSDIDPSVLFQAAKKAFGQNDLKAAIRFMAMFQNAEPEDADGRHLNGLIAQRQGRLIAAHDFVTQALESEPYQPRFQLTLANIMRQQGDREPALDLLNKVLSDHPEFASAYAQRGAISIELGDEVSAEADFQQAMVLAPDDITAYGYIRMLKAQQGKYDHVVKVCEFTLEKFPNAPAFVHALAVAYERLSQLDDALEWVERALELTPKNIQLTVLWARIKRRMGDFQSGQDRLTRFSLKTARPQEARLVHAELGQTFDRLDDADGAFNHFSAQNVLSEKIAQKRSIDKASYLRQVRDLSAACTDDNFSQWTELPAPTPLPSRPVFLVGFPRSGTTLLDQVLDSHPGVQVIEERPVLLPLRDAIEEMDGGYPAGLSLIDEAMRDELRALYWQGLVEAGAEEGKLVVNKLPLNLIHGALIHRIFPDAQFIFALRHPCDVVLSCFMQDFELNASMANFLTLPDAAGLYEEVMSLWQKYREALPLEVTEIRYEALVADLEGAVSPVIEALGLTWDESMREHVAHAKSRGSLRTPSYAQVTQPIYQRATDRWRRYETYINRVKPRLQPYIDLYGYE
ncbi:MAG: sulfotransferase [Parvibaculaceae bacterium]|nr:sulfotransferase [Parvibaculaceae bacterium]